MSVPPDEIDGHSPKYGLTVDELVELMEITGHEGYEVIQSKYGGINELCKKLYTSSNEGECKCLVSKQKI